MAVKPKAAPRLTIFDEEVDPDEGLFGPGRKPSPRSQAEDSPPRDRKYRELPRVPLRGEAQDPPPH